MDAAQDPFDRTARRRARDRAALGFGEFAFLKDALCADLAERLSGFDLSFRCILDLGAHDARFGPYFPDAHVVAADAGFRFARLAKGVMCDEDRLPFAAASFDAVVSAASLHGVNDLPGALVQIRRCLKPRGVFIASFVAGASLLDIRARILAAELELRGGASPRFLPMVDPREAPSLLQRAGFTDPVVDIVPQTISYADAGAMLRDVRGMGESNIAAIRERRPAGRDLRARMLTAAKANERTLAQLEIVTLTARAP